MQQSMNLGLVNTNNLPKLKNVFVNLTLVVLNRMKIVLDESFYYLEKLNGDFFLICFFVINILLRAKRCILPEVFGSNQHAYALSCKKHFTLLAYQYLSCL